jgi:hypothetical protein
MITIQLRRPDRRTPPSVHSCTCRSSSALSARPAVGPPRSIALIPCGLFRTAFPTGPNMPRPPPPRCLLTVAASTEPASLHDRCSIKQARGDEILVTSRPPASCSCRCRTATCAAVDLRAGMPPFVRTKPMLQEYVSSV